MHLQFQRNVVNLQRVKIHTIKPHPHNDNKTTTYNRSCGIDMHRSMRTKNYKKQ